MDEAAILSGLQSIGNGLNTVSSDLKGLAKELKAATAMGKKSNPVSLQDNINVKDLNEVIESLKKNSNSDSLYKFFEDTSKALNKKGDLFELVKKYIDQSKPFTKTEKNQAKTDIKPESPQVFKKLNSTLLKLTNAISRIKPSTAPAQPGFLGSLGQFVKDLKTTTTVTKTQETATDAALKEETIQKISIKEIAPNVLKELKAIYEDSSPKTVEAVKSKKSPVAAIKKQYEAMGKDIAKGITSVTKAASKGIDIVAKSASKGMTAIGKGLTGLGKGAGKGFEALGKGISSMIKSIGSAIPPLAIKLATLANPVTLIGLAALSLAFIAIGAALRLATPALKVLADLLQNVVIKVLEVFRDIIIKIGDVYKEVFIEGLKQAAKIITAIGGAISKVISSIAGGIIKIIDKVVSGVERLAKINPLKLYAVAGGIIAISGALATFAVGQAVAGISNFATGLLGKITGRKGPLETIIELADKSDNIKTAANGIKQISSSLQSLNKVNFKYIASGIKLVTKALATLTRATGGSFITGLLRKITGQKGPLETLLEIANKSDNIKAAGDAIVGISNAFRTFKYIDFDTIAEGITKILKATQSRFSVGGFLNKITGQKNPLELLITFSKSANLLDKAATAIERMSAAFEKFNNIDLEKIKELTKLPLGKIAATAILGSMLSTGAAAQDQTESSVPAALTGLGRPIARAGTETYDPTKQVKNKVESREAGTFSSQGLASEESDFDDSSRLFQSDKTNNLSKAPKPKTEEIDKISPVIDSDSQKILENTNATNFNEKIIDKLDELILKLNRPTVNTASSTLTTGESTAIDNSSVNIFNSGSDRDIPYVERNKYRQQLLYIRGIL